MSIDVIKVAWACCDTPFRFRLSHRIPGSVAEILEFTSEETARSIRDRLDELLGDRVPPKPTPADAKSESGADRRDAAMTEAVRIMLDEHICKLRTLAMQGVPMLPGTLTELHRIQRDLGNQGQSS